MSTPPRCTDTRTRGREPFALEDMPQVPAACGASDLCAGHPKRMVFVASDGARNRCTRARGSAVRHGRKACGTRTVEERRPAAPAVELGRALVQRRAAAGAGVHAVGLVLVVLARAGGLGALLAEDTELCASCELLHRQSCVTPRSAPAQGRARPSTRSRSCSRSCFCGGVGVRGW